MTDREHSGAASPWGVLLLAHGAPERLSEIPEFLLNVRGGRPLPEAAVQEIVHRYSLIGGGSPLARLTNEQAAALAAELSVRVYVGMRNWKPFITDAVRHIAEDRLERAVAVCLAPQNSRTSIGLYARHLNEAVARVAPGLPVEFIESWHDQPGLISALREKLLAALDRYEAEAGGRIPVIFTAHSVPERTVAAGDPYEQQVRETARLVAEALGPGRLPSYEVAFQSQGMTAEPWLGPTVESKIDALAANGLRWALLAPIGFVSDHVEILYDIDVAFRAYAERKNVRLVRTESLNSSPLFIQGLAQLISSRIARVRSQGRSQ